MRAVGSGRAAPVNRCFDLLCQHSAVWVPSQLMGVAFWNSTWHSCMEHAVVETMTASKLSRYSAHTGRPVSGGGRV